MTNNLKTGVVESINGNGITLISKETREYIELNDDVINGLSVGDEIRIVYINQRLVRVFNISTETLYEVDINPSKSVYMKRQSLVFLVASVICAIPIAGALVGMVLIAGIIGSSIKYGKNVLAKVAGVSLVSSIVYLAVSAALIVYGHFFLSFLACTAIVYIALTCASKIQDSKALALSKVAIADNHCLNFKAANI